MSGTPLLHVDRLSKVFATRGHRLVHAVREVSLTLEGGGSLGIVGETGSGKTTVARCIIGLESPSSGTVCFEGVDVHTARTSERATVRRNLQMVFQDPARSLNPRLSVQRTLTEQLVPTGVRGLRAVEAAREALASVDLPERYLTAYPGQLSGGQKQRVAIARALVVRPACVVLDEPTSALDMTVKNSILHLLERLRGELHLAYLLISHDLGVVARLCDRVQVMYRGRIVETGRTREVFEWLGHPYTRALISAIPTGDADRVRERLLLREIEGGHEEVERFGCNFRDRCPFAVSRCTEGLPPFVAVGPEHHVACFRAPELADTGGRP